EIRAVTAEKLHATRCTDLVERMEHHARHAALVVFVRTVNVEEFQTRPEEGLVLLRQCPLVEIVLAVAVRVQWLQLVRKRIIRVAVTQFAITVGGCGGSVDQRNAILHTSLPHLLAVAYVELIEDRTVE